MYGNGGQWYIVDIYGRKVVIDTTTQYATPVLVPDYNGSPYTCHTTADNLESFLMHCDATIQESRASYYGVKEMAKRDILNGKLVYTNGNHWFMLSGGYIVCYELGISGETAVVRSYDALASWKYIRATKPVKAEVTDSIKKYFGIFS